MVIDSSIQTLFGASYLKFLDAFLIPLSTLYFVESSVL
jgi:hypothetical protein